MASSDIGALGAKDGSSVDFTWELPSPAPLLLPWLIVLVLLALKPNRHGVAWLIWLPLGAAAAFTTGPATSLFPPGLDFLLDAVTSLAFGLTAVWLLSDYLRRSHRLLTFFGILFTLGGFSALVLVVKQGLYWQLMELFQGGMVLAVGTLASAVALTFSGWISRKSYRPVAIYVWLVITLVLIWLVVVAPFFLFALLASNGGISWSDFFTPVLIAATGNFVLILPFLILSSASPFFSKRLQALLHLNLNTALPSSPVAAPTAPEFEFHASKPPGK